MAEACMFCVTLRVQTPRGGWCRALGLRQPGLGLRVVSCYPLSSGAMQEMVELAGPQWREAMGEIAAHPDVERVDLLQSTPTSAALRLRVRGCPFPGAFAETGVIPRFPINVQDGAEEWLVISNEGEAGELLKSLERRGVRAEVVRSGPYEPTDALTKRQRELLDRAVEEGYYSYPRRITLTRLAEKLGLAKSTLSEILMLVEQQVMAAFQSKAGPPPTEAGAPQPRGRFGRRPPRPDSQGN